MGKGPKAEAYDPRILGSQIFACAIKALSCCVTRFPGYGISDLLERSYQSELYAHLREEFDPDGVEAEVPYPNDNAKTCDMVVYPDEDHHIFLEIKLWNSGSKLERDIDRVRDAIGESEHLGFVLNLESLVSNNVPMGNSDLENTDQEAYWFSLFPAPNSKAYPGDKFACISMYRVKP